MLDPLSSTTDALTTPDLRTVVRPRYAYGQTIGDIYEIRGLLGIGGMSEVYEAEDRALNRRVAIKVSTPEVDPEYLLREGRGLAAIRHPGVVAVYAMGVHESVSFLVLERVRGLALDQVIMRREAPGLSVPETLHLVSAVAEALQAVHETGLTHRDVKPSNVMLAAGRRVVLMDFGLVLAHVERAENDTVAGSIPYMAPEALGAAVLPGMGQLLDVYGLGVLAHELLSGESPFRGSAHAIRQQKLDRDKAPPVAPGRSDIPRALRELIMQMIAVDPQERPRTMEDVVLRLRSIRSQTEVHRGPLAAVVADDDDDSRGAIAALIEVEVPDAQVVVVEDGPSALRAVRRRVPDVLFLDLDMPGMNGIEVCMTLRGSQLADGCEVVLVSGRASRADERLLRHLGVQCIPKGPRLVEEIPRILRRLRRGAPEGP